MKERPILMKCAMVRAVRIYRIQGPDGRGPFRPGLTEQWIGEPRWQDRPSLIEEFDMRDVLALVKGRHMGCGFRTPDQLRKWFDDGGRDRCGESEPACVRLADTAPGWIHRNQRLTTRNDTRRTTADTR